MLTKIKGEYWAIKRNKLIVSRDLSIDLEPIGHYGKWADLGHLTEAPERKPPSCEAPQLGDCGIPTMAGVWRDSHHCQSPMSQKEHCDGLLVLSQHLNMAWRELGLATKGIWREFQSNLVSAIASLSFLHTPTANILKQEPTLTRQRWLISILLPGDQKIGPHWSPK